MDREYKKDVLTTGDVARICHVAPRTVSKWFDTGKLRGYRIPGSRDRRIPLPRLLAFMRAHGIPLDALDGGICRALLVGVVPSEVVDAVNQTSRHRLQTATNGFEAGVIAQRFRPHVILVDVTATGPQEAISICRNVKASAELATVKVVAIVPEGEPCDADDLTSHGFDEYLSTPCTPVRLVEAIEKATNLIT